MVGKKPKPQQDAVPALEGPSAVEPLSAKETKRLASIEAQIERNLQGFVEVGNALAVIRTERLYRGTHGTFDAYVRERWDFQKSYAYRLIDAAEAVQNLKTSPIGDKIEVLPASESQARALGKVEPEQQADVWQQVIEQSPRDEHGQPRPTAEIVEKVVYDWITPTEEKKVKAPQEQHPREPHAPKTEAELSEENFERDLERIGNLVHDVFFTWQAKRDRIEVMLDTLRNYIQEFSKAKGL